MPLAAVHVSVGNGTEREGIGDKVGISHVVQPPHLFEERAGAIGAVRIARARHSVDDGIPRPGVRFEVVRFEIAAVAVAVAASSPAATAPV